MSGAIDLDFLRENTFSVDNMRELIEIYLQTTPKMFDDLKREVELGKVDQIKRTAHKLKSNMNTMGVYNGSEILERIEFHAADMTESELADKLVGLASVITGAEAELKNALKEL